MLESRELVLRSRWASGHALPRSTAGELREVIIWRDRCEAQVNSVDTRAWLRAVTGTAGQLVRSMPGAERINPRKFTGEDVGRVRFADAYALLIIGEASLADLNTRLPAARAHGPLPAQPGAAWAACVRAKTTSIGCAYGDIELRCVKPCLRCIVTTTDQTTGERDGADPLRTLESYRWIDSLRGAAFGVNAIVSGAQERSCGSASRSPSPGARRDASAALVELTGTS